MQFSLPMSTTRIILVSLVLSLAVMFFLSWPLPRFMSEGIPASPYSNPGEQQVRGMFPGDHLQLMYYFELFSSTLEGRTPWFSNPYEFNTGEGTQRFYLGFDYFPFSLFYTVGQWIAGPAFGYNLAIFLSVWLSVISTWLLVRRYVQDEAVACLFGLTTAIFPFHWISLFEGSPTGFAMMWVPIVALGLDMAVRDGKLRGGVLAGAGIFLSFLGSKQVFFFTVLLVPAWCILAFLARETFNWKSFKDYISITRALAPVVLFSAAAVYLSRLLAQELAGTKMHEGRGLAEASLFSPRPEGLLSWQPMDISAQVFMGYALPVLLALGGLALCLRVFWSLGRSWRSLLVYLVLLGGIVSVVLLALGPHGPGGGKAFALAREWIPFYAMLRQAGKIFTLMPTLVAVAGALALTALISLSKAKWWRISCLMVVALAFFLEFLPLSRPVISRVDTRQDAYQAVADHARQLGEKPGMLIVVLWPGDTHYSSVYQHWVVRYGIRMVNGYNPAIDNTYYDTIFQRFISVNHGYLDDDQADELLARGIRYLALHEDMFPEKVSPFPVTYTLKAFLNHPRLSLLQQADRVWAFEILEAPVTSPDKVPHWVVFLPARHWGMERHHLHQAEVRDDPTARRGRYVALEQPGAAVSTSYTGAPPAPELRWMIRVRGQGDLSVETHQREHGRFFQESVSIDQPDWTWIESPIPLESFAVVSLRAMLQSGRLDVDAAFLGAGNWPELALEESWVIPAPCFFHAGYTDLAGDEVVFLKRHDHVRNVFYGPRLPLPPGRYAVDFRFTSPAVPGTGLGVVHLQAAGEEDVYFPVTASSPATGVFRQQLNLPFELSFIFSGQGDLRIKEVVLTRLALDGESERRTP